MQLTAAGEVAPVGGADRLPLFIGALILLAVLAYLPFLGGGFQTDDFAHLSHISRVTPVTLVNSPDVFGFYRPITQLSLKLDTMLWGETAFGLRMVNLFLHGAVLAAAFVVARQVLGTALGAALAVLAYALTPKAHPIAVLWISARAELLMSLFTLLGVVAWIRWNRGARGPWLAVAAAAYVAAVLSKETAILLPAVVLFLPGATRALRKHFAGVVLLVGLAALLLAVRFAVGARMPISFDAHYNPGMPIANLIHNIKEYADRMVPAPLALVVLVSVATWRVSGIGAAFRGAGWPALAWSVGFLAPALPFVARSELYLYLPVFGLCLLSGALTAAILSSAPLRHTAPVAIMVFAVALGGYQVSRSVGIHRSLVFSERFVAALATHREIVGAGRPIAVVPADPETERHLRNAVEGFLLVILQRLFPGELVEGDVDFNRQQTDERALRLLCVYRDGVITLAKMN